MLKRQFHRIILGFIMLWAVAAPLPQSSIKASDIPDTQYLAFQVFTGSPSPNIPIGGSGTQPLDAPPSKATMKQFVREIVDQIGATGDPQHKLAFIIGPLAFDHTDDQLQQIVRDAFEIAVELNIAVGFHIDDSIFWARRSDLWSDPKNVEWLNREGTPNTGRRIDWGPQPIKLAPQMCFNSPAIEAEVTRLANQVIGRAIREEVSKLIAQGRSELFAGVIVGWETQIGQDFETSQYLGYCALANRGFDSTQVSSMLDAERVKAVQAFIQLWAGGIKQAGIDARKIYSHTALITQSAFDTMNLTDMSYSRFNHFAPSEVSFGVDYKPGFSTYPQPGLMEQLYADLQKHGNPAWASAEGSTVIPSALESAVKTETYLSWMFNHHATLVNIFGWGIASKGENPFWKAAASSEAVAAYRKFLSGQPLIEETTDQASIIEGRLSGKIKEIQAALPEWFRQHPDQQSRITLLMNQLEAAIKAGDYQAAGTAADSVLELLRQ